MANNLRILIEFLLRGQGASQAQTALRGVERDAQRGSWAVNALSDGLEQLTKSLIAVGAVGVLRQTFEFAKEGAEIQRLQAKFEALAESVGSSSASMLSQLQTATNGMVDDLTLMTNGAQFLAMGLAKTEEEAARLAEISTKLGMDDAATNMQNFAAMLANLSVERLDSFGISSGRVRERIDELMASTQNLSREDAFLAAVMAEAEVSMARLGDAATMNGDALTRLQVVLQNSTANFKVFLAEGLLPVAESLSNDYGHAVAEMTQSNEAAAESLADLVAQAQGLADAKNIWGGVGVVVTGTSDEINAAIQSNVTVMAQMSASYGEFEGAAVSAFGSAFAAWSQFVHALSPAELERLNAAGIVTMESFYEYAQVLKSDEAETRRLMQTTARYTAVQSAVAAPVQETATGLAYLALVASDAGQAADDYETSAAAVAAAEERRAEAHSAAAEAAEAAAAATSQLAAEMENIAAGALQEQFGLIELLYQAYSDYATAVGNVNTPWDDDAAGATDAAGRIDAATKDMATSYKNMVLEMMVATAGGVFTQDAADFAVAVGLMSQAEADARLEAQRLVAEQERLVGLWQDGKISAEQLGTAAGLLADGLANGADAALRLSDAFDDAYGKGNSLKATLLAIEGEHYVNVTTTWTEVGEPPNIPDPGGGPGEPTEAPMATGGWVTGGVLGHDSVPALLMPGEYVMSTQTVQQLGGRQAVNEFLLAGHGPEVWAQLARPMAAGGWVGNDVEYRSAGLPAGLPAAMAASGSKSSVYNDNRVINHHYHTAGAVAAGRAFSDFENRQRRNEFMGE